jgi:hypothetical protein
MLATSQEISLPRAIQASPITKQYHQTDKYVEQTLCLMQISALVSVLTESDGWLH